MAGVRDHSTNRGTTMESTSCVTVITSGNGELDTTSNATATVTYSESRPFDHMSYGLIPPIRLLPVSLRETSAQCTNATPMMGLSPQKSTATSNALHTAPRPFSIPRSLLGWTLRTVPQMCPPFTGVAVHEVSIVVRLPVFS